MRRALTLVLALLGGCAACPDGPPSLCAVPADYFSPAPSLPSPPLSLSSRKRGRGQAQRGSPLPAAPSRAGLEDTDRREPAASRPDIPGQIDWMKSRLEYR